MPRASKHIFLYCIVISYFIFYYYSAAEVYSLS